MFEDDRPRPRDIVVGQDLSAFSVEELMELKAALLAEADRVDREAERKRGVLSGAEALFTPR